MKFSLINKLSLSVIIGFLIIGCQSDGKKNIKSDINIPQLLERSDKTKLGKEWDFVQNFYADQKTSLANDGESSEAYLQLAELYIREARVTGEHGHYYPAALEMVEKVLNKKEQDPDIRFRALVTKAGVQLSLHEFSESLITGKKALALNGRNAQVMGVLVDCYVELGQYDKAVKIADEMSTTKPDIRSYSRISYLREIHGDVDGAKAALKLAVESGFPGYEETAWAMLTLGDLYKRYGDQKTAQKIYNEILIVREDYPFAVAALGDIEFDKGNLKEAKKIHEEAIDIIPEVGFYVTIAHVLKKQDKTEALDSIIKEIWLMLEDDVQAGHNMNLEYADIYLNILDNKDKALEYAQMEYDKRPENIDVNRLLAKIYLAKEDKEKAKVHFEKASVTGSKHPELLELKNKL